MQFKIKLVSEADIVLPFQYNNIIQAVLLNMINDKEYSDFVHNKGYAYEAKNFKLYTFSRLIGKAVVNRKNKMFNYGKTVSLFVSSMDERFLQHIFEKFLEENKVIKLQNNLVKIEGIEVNDIVDIKEVERVKTLSPITTYTTVYTTEGKKMTYYYSVYEKKFTEDITENLKKKYFSFYGKYPEDDRFEIIAERGVKESVLTYKETIVKGWNGDFVLKGSKEMMKVAFEAGLGSKNSVGFGMVMRRGR